MGPKPLAELHGRLDRGVGYRTQAPVDDEYNIKTT
jgi:hypothetical protein